HALRVIDREARDFEPLARRDTFLADVNAIDRTGLCTLIASDAGGQIVAMKAAIPGGNRHRQLGIFKMLGEGFAIAAVRDEPIAKRDPHAVSDSENGVPNITKPAAHRSSLRRLNDLTNQKWH